jgi:glycosyltransferase involved in cell wall biosynthesis
LAEAQARLGHDVSVYFVSKFGEKAIVPDEALVEAIEFPMTIRSKHYGWSRSFARALKTRVSTFDVVHIHAIWNFPTWWAMRCAKRMAVPYIVAPQGSLETWALSRSKHLKHVYAAFFEKGLYDRASRMQALTAVEERQCRQFGIRAASEILPNGVDLTAIESASEPADLRHELGLGQGDQLIIFLGRIFPKKGLDLLAQAFGRLARERSGVTLLIAGHDSGTGYSEQVREMLAAENALERTHFLGEVSGQRKFEVLRGSDLFVLPSYSEGLPVAVLEAMAVALPVVITHQCNLPEVEEYDAGWITESKVDCIYQCLRRGLDDPQERKRRGRNAAALVKKHFTWDRIAQRSVEIYASMRKREITSVHRPSGTRQA